MSQVPYCVLYNITLYNNEFQSGGEQLKQYSLFTIYSNDCLIYKDINTLYDIIIIISRDTTIGNKHNLYVWIILSLEIIYLYLDCDLLLS